MVNCANDDLSSCCGGICHFNPVVVIATNNRIEITTKNISLLKAFKIVVVVSNYGEEEYFKSLGVYVVMTQNNPLGAKWQSGVNKARELEANPLIILGSDDFLSINYRTDTLQLHLKGFTFVGMTKWVSYDAVNGDIWNTEYTNFNKNFPIGSGRSYTKSLLDQINWKIFDVRKNRLLDDLGYNQARNYGKIKLIDTAEVLAVKGKWECLNPMRAYLTSKNIKAEKTDLSILKKFNYVE